MDFNTVGSAHGYTVSKLHGVGPGIILFGDGVTRWILLRGVLPMGILFKNSMLWALVSFCLEMGGKSQQHPKGSPGRRRG